MIGQTCVVLAEAVSKRSEENLQGRNDQNQIVVFPRENYRAGDYVRVVITDCTSATLMGKTE